MATQIVTIEFQADYSQLEKGVDLLAKTGKVDAELATQFKKTNTEINKQGKEFEKTTTAATREVKTLKQLSDLMAQFPKTGLNRFLLQMGQELTKAGVKAEDFKKKLNPKDVEPKIDSLRARLRQLREQMQQVALTSGVMSEEYKKLRQEAGQLDDTIKDVNNDIANAGSDTRGIDNVVGALSALAGGYSAVQGAAALFGDESEELQKALLRVNASMALATGAQQFLNATTKEGSITRLLDVTATKTQIAVQKIYTFVTGRATAATLAFKVALAATGIGLVIVALIAFVAIIKSSTHNLDRATAAVDRHRASLESLNTLLDQQQAIRIAEAQKIGALESEVIRIRGKGVVQQIENLRQSTKELIMQRDALSGTSEAWHVLNNEIGKNAETRKQLDTDLLVLSIQLERQLLEERLKAIDQQERRALAGAKSEKQKFDIAQKFDRARLAELQKSGVSQQELQEKQTDIFIRQREREVAIAKRQREALLNIERERIEQQLVLVQSGSIAEFELKKKLLEAQKIIELENADLTANERKLILEKYFKESLELEKAFKKSSLLQANEDEKSRINALLANLNLTEEKKLQLTIDFLQIAADAEIQAAEGNAAKIKEINAKLNTDIAAAKVASIKKIADDELRLSAAAGGPARRALEFVSQNERMKFEVRLNALRQLAVIEVEAIDREILANREANMVKGADNRALHIEYMELLDRRAAATEAVEREITDISREANMERIRIAIDGLQRLGAIASDIAATNQQAAEESINRQRRELDDLVQAGAITEREAERRNKKIEAEERAAKNRAAQAQKQLAVFNAFLAIPQAFIAGLTAPFPIGGPIYGGILAGLAAIQAGIVASRPVPKFATGKKGSYSGPGIVGDAGAELIEREDGSMHVAMKPELVYLGPKDKVFTAQETKQRMPFVNKEAIRGRDPERMNYDKLASAINKGQKPSGSTVVNIDKEFISESVANGLMRSRYFDRYYRSK
jgi:hypothetical protein